MPRGTTLTQGTRPESWRTTRISVHLASARTARTLTVFTDGVSDWTLIDTQMAKGRANGASVLLVLGETPQFL